MTGRRSSSLKQQRSIATREAILYGASRVFARVSFTGSRLKDISEESGISEGSLYFHFGTKDEIAIAVLEAQQEKMAAVLSEVLETPNTTLEKFIELMRRLATLIATDEVVQGGIMLAGQPIKSFSDSVSEPYFEWVRIGTLLISEGLEDGSVDPDIDVASAAEFVNVVFVGAQVLSGLSDSWSSLPSRIDRQISYVAQVLGGPGVYVPEENDS